MTQNKEIKIYTTQICPFCNRAKALLQAKGYQYSEIRVDLDEAKLKEMVKLSGRTSVPQIFIGEQPIGGSDELAELVRAGKLDDMVN